MEKLTLYWAPHTCAIGIHVLLEELGRPYEMVKIDVAGGETEKPEFKAINPKGKVPTLVREDGTVLTEFGSIALWLARTSSGAKLVPAGPEAERRVFEVLDYVVDTIHGHGFTRIFKPESFEPPDIVHATLGLGKNALRKRGKEIAGEGFELLAEGLRTHEWAAGDSFTIADAALFYVERWAPMVEVPLPEPIAAHLARMKARPAVQRVMKMWGE